MTWEIARASGFVAYGLLAASVVAGLLVSSKLFGRAVPPKALTYLHEGLAVSSLLAVAVHLVALAVDTYVEFDLAALLLPGASEWGTQAVSLGVVAMWTMLIVTVSFYVRSRIGQKAWRTLHYASFGAFVAAFAHGIMAGTDTGNPVALVLYGSTGGLIAVLIVGRILLAGETRRPVRAAAPASAARESARP
ncbi:MAG: ferric reductase-like transmembrane domain-containing protein [Actinobacteria bacterium]|nr:ferric reductase-like transmembrane domain-containing protein [Actinomycetota bacterium]